MKALMHFDHVQPDLVLANFDLPGMNGLQLAQALALRSPETKVIITFYDWHEVGPGKPLNDPAFISNSQLYKTLPRQVMKLLADSHNAAAPPSRLWHPD
jgi:DNA-binding LytR/AlgR family response regulator